MHYLARYETEHGDVCQGVVAFPAAPRQQAWYSDIWFERLSRLLRARHAIPDARFSCRLSFRGRQVDQLVMIQAPAHQEETLRKYLANFLELLIWADGSVALPLDRNQHDEWAQCWPSHLCPISTSGYREHNCWLACNFRVHPVLPDLLDEADALGIDLFYQANLHAADYTPSQEKCSRYNGLAVEQLTAAPLFLQELQSALLSRSSGPAQFIQEFVGASSAAGAQWLSQRLQAAFKAALGPTKLPSPVFTFQHSRFQSFIPENSLSRELVTLGVHEMSVRELEDDEWLNFMMSSGEEELLLTWSGQLRRWFEPGNTELKARVRHATADAEKREQTEAAGVHHVLDAWQPPIQISNAPSGYNFISYKRGDLEQIVPLLSALNSAHQPFWIDRAIPGSSSWMEVLQQRIQNCRSLVLFLSNESAASKWVRHEVTYAYSLNKPVLPVLLDPNLRIRNLPGGLGFLLNPIHSIHANPDELAAQLRLLSTL